jgi:hypothetical protein
MDVAAINGANSVLEIQPALGVVMDVRGNQCIVCGKVNICRVKGGGG